MSAKLIEIHRAVGRAGDLHRRAAGAEGRVMAAEYTTLWSSGPQFTSSVPALQLRQVSGGKARFQLLVGGSPIDLAPGLDGSEVVVPIDIFGVECGALSDWLSPACLQLDPGYTGIISLHDRHVFGIQVLEGCPCLVAVGWLPEAQVLPRTEWLLSAVIDRTALVGCMNALDALRPKPSEPEAAQ